MATKPHGLRGEIYINSDPSTHEAIQPDSRIRLVRGEDSREFRVRGVRTARGGLLLSLDGVEDRDAAEHWAGAEVLVSREALLRDADTYFDFELVGLDVIARDGTALGRIAEVLGTGANDVLVVSGEHGELLIPAVTSAVLEVDTRAGRVTVDERVVVREREDSAKQ